MCAYSKTCFMLALLLGGRAQAEVTFEGYYRVETDGKHSGFSAYRTEYDVKNEVRTIRFYSKQTGEPAREEGIKLRQSKSYLPLSFEHYVKDFSGSHRDKIDVKDGFYVYATTKGGNKSERMYTLPKQVHFSMALGEILM